MNNQSFDDFSFMNSNSSFSTNHTNNTQSQNLEMTNGVPFVSPNLKQGIQKKQNVVGNGNLTSRGTSNFAKSSFSKGNNARRKVLSVSQILARVHQKKQRKLEQKKRKKPFKPIIPPKSFILLFKDKPEKYIYNRRIIDYKHCGLLQRYIGLGGKILPRRQTKLTAKQQRYVAKTIKSARIMGLLPFVTKERSFFR
uniref:ribosomal protein S18 n=1 Tax=Coelastrella saipanensis TaxID=152631 RepID=UPI0010C248C7|nr:ribosomal protein S18 [Coelastrella saipanensis]AVV61602.1 ribosomal protein S18 [Coelastrella saipanensis]